MTLERLQGWRGALNAAVAAHRGHGFAWGTHDCATFAADCVLAMTGIDFAASFRGRYDSAEGAARLLAAAGYRSHVDLAAAVLPEIHPAEACRGDIAVVPTEANPALGVVTGATIALFGLGGIGFVRLDRAIRAFRVG